MKNVFYGVDSKCNIYIGITMIIDTYNSVIYSSDKFAATVCIDNKVVVETSDVVLFCNKDIVQDVKLAVKRLNKEGRKELI